MTDHRDQPPGREPAWEVRARTILGAGEHDPELGVRAARDAQRVVAGELDEDAFRQRYRDPYLEAFGIDERPRLDQGPAGPDRTDDIDRRTDDGAAGLPAGPDHDGERPDPENGTAQAAVARGEAADEPAVISRRTALGAVGGAAAGLLFVGDLMRRGAWGAEPGGAGSEAALAGAPGGTAPPGQALPVQFGMVIDLELCDGCLTCVKACVDENGNSDGVLWPYVFAYQEPEDVDDRFLVRLCQHCTRAPCVMVCPTGARHRRAADGLVLTDYDVCIGCRYCQVACPYGVNLFQWADPADYGGSFEGERRDARGVAVKGDPPKGVMGKCTFCPLRQDDPQRRGTAACVDACQMDALHIGDLNDPDSAPNRHLAKRREEAGGNLPTFRLLEDLGTDPNIIYIGHPPSARAELVEGAWAYEDWGLTEDRRAVLEGPEPWFARTRKEA